MVVNAMVYAQLQNDSMSQRLVPLNGSDIEDTLLNGEKK